MDIHICGSCRGEFHDLEDFIQHKRSPCPGPTACDLSVQPQDQRPLTPQVDNGTLQTKGYPTLPPNHAMEQLAQNVELSKPPDPIAESITSSIDQQQVVEISPVNSMEYVVNVMNSGGQKVSLSQSSPDHLILPQHQQDQLRQILDTQKVDLAGIDMSKVIVLNPQNVQNVVKPNQPKFQPEIQPNIQPKPQHVQQQIVSIPVSSINASTPASTSNMQILTVDQLWNNQTLQVVNAGDLLKGTIRGGGGDEATLASAITTMAGTENITVSMCTVKQHT